MGETKKMVVLLSGSGTTLQNLMDRVSDGRLPGWRIVKVISSRPDAYGLVRAENHGIPTEVIQRKKFRSTELFSDAVWTAVRPDRPDLVVFAGWMCLLAVPDDFRGRIMNVHPALIPAFCGKGMYGHHVHEAVVAKGVKVTGCTVHFVDEEYDHGPIILQKPVEIDHSMTPEQVAEKVQAAEREIYPEAIRLFGEGRLKIRSNVVEIY